MIEYGPKQMILDHFRTSEHTPSEFTSLISERNGFWQPVKYKARLPQGAQAATVQFLKEKSIPGYQVHAITFKDVAEITWLLFCLLVQDIGGNWHVEGCSGNAGNATLSRPFSRRLLISLSGDLNDHFYAGGYILDDNHIGIGRVRLISDGRSIGEDEVQNGLVVFVSNQKVQLPIQAEFYNLSGNLVHTNEVSLM